MGTHSQSKYLHYYPCLRDTPQCKCCHTGNSMSRSGCMMCRSHPSRHMRHTSRRMASICQAIQKCRMGTLSGTSRPCEGRSLRRRSCTLRRHLRGLRPCSARKRRRTAHRRGLGCHPRSSHARSWPYKWSTLLWSSSMGRAHLASKSSSTLCHRCSACMDTCTQCVAQN